MAKKYSELQARMSPKAQALAKERAQKLLAELPLHSLRLARQLSQETLADTLGISQPQVSKIEHRTDLYLSTLRRYVEAMGGQLEILARFADGLVRITQFNSLEPESERGSVAIAGGENRAQMNAAWSEPGADEWGGRKTASANCGWSPRLVKGGREDMAW